MSTEVPASTPPIDRQQMAVDIACVGFGPAMGGFLTTLSRNLLNSDGTPKFDSPSVPGAPLQVICYERAEGLGFGVSGAVTRGRGIRATFPAFDLSQIPLAVAIKQEKLVYLLDPIGASRRSLPLRAVDRLLRTFRPLLSANYDAFELPFVPSFMNKHGGFILSLGQFNQWVADQLSASGLVQIWPGTPVSEPLIEGQSVIGVRLADQGTDLYGSPGANFLPGMDIRAALTVIGDGPVGAVGRALDASLGFPSGNDHSEWALGMKMVIELREDSGLEPGTVIHTLGFPEPEIFGFLYTHTDCLASAGIFIPSWFRSPVRTAYRYLQHFLLHPYFWRYVQGGTLKSWGSKSVQESGRHGEPCLVGDGYARIGEGSGSTNVLAGSGIDEAWTTGTQLAEAVIELLQNKQSFTRENLENTYVRRRRTGWLDKESRAAADSRNGFEKGVVRGLIGMALAGFTGGRLAMPKNRHTNNGLTPENFFAGRISSEEWKRLKIEAASHGQPLHDLVMNRCGWPEIPCDGQLLVSHQDALMMGGSVQAPPGYANHVVFLRPEVCGDCEPKLCFEMCSGQAITRGDQAVPQFDREKCVFCGACVWNCNAKNIDFRAGAGGLHSALN
jgi:electron-transferring-flavoprotein dehydrogenase